MSHTLRRLLLAATFALLAPAQAQPALQTADLPKLLQDWLPWAWHGHLAERCPKAFDGQVPQPCVWPALLELKAQASGASFRFEVHVYGPPARVALPGEESVWPQDVRADGKALAVTEFEGGPALLLNAGRHVIEGRLPWRTVPQDLQLPPGIASLQATLNGQTLRQRPGDDGRLPLQAAPAEAAEAGEALSIRTVRRIDDDIPLRLTTQFTLTVSGRAREVLLPLALLPGWQAHEIRSPLPARLGEDGQLRVQARPGNWTLELESRSLQPLQQIALPAGGVSDEEVWSFAAHNELRVVTVSGGRALDPRQVEMPEDWRSLPAFRLKPGEALQLTQSRRGTEQPEADALNLRRVLWLDFDGRGFTVQDAIDGKASRSTRLDLHAPAVLGRAALQGEDQTLTQGGSGAIGFALRRSRVQIQADARIEGRARSLPATGWGQDFESVSAELRLPPGWMLLHAQGPERAQGSWVASWTLWDLFFLLLAALAAGRLLGWRSGALLGVALTLAWHLEHAPAQGLWLGLLALLALRQALPAAHGLRRWVDGAYRLGLLLMVLSLLRFAVDQAHFALHPQLDVRSASWADERQEEARRAKQGLVDMNAPSAAPPFVPIPEIMVKAPGSTADSSRYARLSKRSASAEMPDADKRLNAEHDPHAKVQTGPGLPVWSWRAHALQWQGPVHADQQLSLWLLPPTLLGPLRLLAVLLLALAVGLLARGAWPWADSRLQRWLPKQRGRAAPLLLVLVLMLCWPLAQAEPSEPVEPKETPSAELLTELRARTNPPPSCLPRCAEVARGFLSAQGSRVQLRLDLHAQAAVAVPLPGQGTHWTPEHIAVDGQPASTRRDADGALWLLLPAGVSQVLLASDVGAVDTVGINLPMPLRELRSELQGWSLSGLDARGLPSGALSLVREAQQASGGTAGAAQADDHGTPRDALPALALVRRELQLGLGLQWRVLTRVSRLSPSRAPVALRIALLAGESVTDARVKVADGAMQLQLGGEHEIVITSTLKPQAHLRLKASDSAQQLEHWSLSASPAWRVTLGGIAPIRHQQNDEWGPFWQPWPGEQVELQIAKPTGVEGQTLTLDRLHIRLEPGAQSSNYRAELLLRASLGGEHSLQLPPGAELQELQLNGTPLPVQARQGRISLPLTPGSHRLLLRWRGAAGQASWLRTESLGLGVAGVNETLSVTLPRDRVVLAMGLSGAPALGPAVLFWGVLLVLLGAVALLRRQTDLPLSSRAWLLLALGLAPASLAGLAVLLGWFLLLRQRARWVALPRWQHNALQVAVLIWTLLTALALLYALRTGLLGHPDLLVQGNDSNAHALNWYLDRVSGHSHSAWVLSLPIWVYRVAMLLWALWLAHALLGWVRWAWGCFSAGGLWRSKPKRVVPPPSET